MNKYALLTKEVEQQVREAKDPAEYVYNLTRDPEIAVNFLKFRSKGQVALVKKNMSTQSAVEKRRYMENLIAKGKEFIS